MSKVAARAARWSRAALRTAALVAAASALSACASAPVAPKPTPPISLGLIRQGRGAGPDLAVISHPSGDRVQLSLWLDAGARDASPPQVATVAAWLAAEAAGGRVRAEVFPDGIELATACRKGELASCLTRLQGALAFRRPDSARLGSALARLADGRRAADAGDPGRAADRLALQALYGADRGAGLFPLGVASDDAGVTAARVAEFIARHFGPERALLIAVGELDADSLDDASAGVFARAPRAGQSARVEHAAPTGEDAVAVDVADAQAITLALAAPSLAQAHAAAAAFKSRLGSDGDALGLRGAVRGHVFEVRGAALALLRVPARDAPELVRTAAHELERLRREGLADEPSRPVQPHAPDALARRLGLRWTTFGSASAPAGGIGLAVGVLVAGGRADALAQRDPDAALRDKTGEQLEAAFEAGQAQGDPSLHGEIGADAVAVTLDNGARLAVRPRASERMAVALRFERGAGSEPPTLHGRTALLATLIATACAGLSPEQLAARLQALGAELTPRVDAESWGVTLGAPSASWQPALALALECGLHPGLERRHLSSARARLVEQLGPEGGGGELQAAVAEHLWPSAPGMLAPWGSPARQASVSLAAVRELWVQARRGSGVSVAIVGAVPAEAAAQWAARRIAVLASDPLPPAPAQPPVPVQPKVSVEQPTLGLALWSVQGGETDAAGAQAFAALMRAALGQVPGVSAVWHGGGVTSDGGWAAVGLSGAPEPLAAAARALREAARALAAASLTRAADQAFELAERARAAALADPALEAETIARAAFHAAPQQNGSLERARALASRLAQADPVWVPLRD